MGTRQRIEPFFGRAQTIELIDQFLLPPLRAGDQDGRDDSGDALRSFAICGLGGMGKTALAIEYAHSRRDNFEAVFWLGADDAKILASNFAQIAEKLGLEDDHSDLAASRDIAMGWLSLPLKKTSEPDTPDNIANWLIILTMSTTSTSCMTTGPNSVVVPSLSPAVTRSPSTT